MATPVCPTIYPAMPVLSVLSVTLDVQAVLRHCVRLLSMPCVVGPFFHGPRLCCSDSRCRAHKPIGNDCGMLQNIRAVHAAAPVHAGSKLRSGSKVSLRMLCRHATAKCKPWGFRERSRRRKCGVCRCGQGQEGGTLPVHIFQCQVSAELGHATQCVCTNNILHQTFRQQDLSLCDRSNLCCTSVYAFRPACMCKRLFKAAANKQAMQ